MPSAGRRALGGARCNYYWRSKRVSGRSRACGEPDAKRRTAVRQEASAKESGEKRCASARCRGRAAGDGSGATEPRGRKDGALPSAPASARDRHRTAKTAKRASWSRAGRSRARRNRARRPVRRTGRAPNPSDRRSGRWRAVIGDDGRCPTSDRVRRILDQGCHDRNRGGVQCGIGKKGRLAPVRWRRAKRDGKAVHRTASRRAEEGGIAGGEEGPASVRRRRASAEPAARPGRVARCGMAAQGARAATVRQRRAVAEPDAQRRCAALATEQKGGAGPRRSEEPALTG